LSKLFQGYVEFKIGVHFSPASNGSDFQFLEVMVQLMKLETFSRVDDLTEFEYKFIAQALNKKNIC